MAAADEERLRRVLAEDGYVIIRGFLSDQVGVLSDAIDDLYAQVPILLKDDTEFREATVEQLHAAAAGGPTPHGHGTTT